MVIGEASTEALATLNSSSEAGPTLTVRLDADVVLPILSKYRKRQEAQGGKRGKLENLARTVTRLVRSADEFLAELTEATRNESSSDTDSSQ